MPNVQISIIYSTTTTPGPVHECCCKKNIGFGTRSYLSGFSVNQTTEMIVLNECTIEVIEYNN